MYNPPYGYNTNSNYNKFKPTYFNGDIDISGGNLILRKNGSNFYMPFNGNIYSSNNRIEFNDISNNNYIYFHTPLKMFYNSIEYDIGERLQAIAPTTTKCTNMSYSSLTNQTSFSNLLEFTGTLNGYSASNFNNAINRTYGLTSDCQSQISTLSTNLSTAITNISTLTNKLTNVSFTTPTTFIIGTTETNVLKFNTSLNGITPTILTYLSNVTSDIQQQINNVSSVSLSANNVFTGLCKFTNTLQLDSSLVIKTLATSITLTGDNLTRIQYLSNVSSDVNTSITNLNSSVSTLNTKTTKMSYMSFGGVNTTTFTDNLISQTFSFTGSINNIAPTTFGYISDLTSSAQQQISNLATKVTGLSY